MSRWAPCTSPAAAGRPSGPATWTGRSGRASAPPRRRWPRCRPAAPEGRLPRRRGREPRCGVGGPPQGQHRKAGSMTASMRMRCAALAALAAASLGAPAALAQDLAPQYPVPGGETFAAGLDQWTPDADAGCTVLGALSDPLCSISNDHVADHDGSLRTTFTAAANAFGAADGTGGFTSPQFTVPADAEIGPATLSLDRVLTSDAPLIDSGPAARLTIDLLDQTDPQNETRMQIAGIDLGALDAQWARQLVSLGEGSVQPGHVYRIKTTAQLTSEQAQALQGDVAVGLDNIGVRTDPPPADGLQGPPGDAGAIGATGATGQT